MTMPADEGGEAACWAHLVDAPLPDIGGRVHVERFVRDFYRQAAMDDVLGPVFACGRDELEQAHRDARRVLVVATVRRPRLRGQPVAGARAGPRPHTVHR